MAAPICEQCRWWSALERPNTGVPVLSRDPQPHLGRCRRYPPATVVPVATPQGPQPIWVWPVTMAEDGCGEWQGRREAAAPGTKRFPPVQ